MSRSRPRVLAVTSEPPWPLNSGGHIRSFHLLRALAAETDLRLVYPVPPGREADARELAARGVPVVPVPTGRRTAMTEAGRLVAAWAAGEPYAMYGRHRWAAAEAAWRREVAAARPDVLYLDHLDSLVYLPPGRPPAPAVIDLHNVYSLLAARAAGEQPALARRLVLRYEARQLARMERRAARRCRAVFAVSATEVDYYRRLGAAGAVLVPNGVDCAPLAGLPTGRPPGPPVVLFLGTLSWGPNAAAARFLADRALPAVRRRHPDARLVVVGRDPPADLLTRTGTGGVEVTGGVPDVTPYLAAATVMAVPLDAGGGTRLKILEGFAAGLPVVSTAVGAEGIDADPGRHFVRAERPEFADALVRLADDPAAATRMAADARELARDRYDWARIGRVAAESVMEVAAAGQSRGSHPY